MSTSAPDEETQPPTHPPEGDTGKIVPYEAVLNGAAITLGLQLSPGQELFLPWIRFTEAQRLAEQLIITIDDWEIRITMSPEKAKISRWEIFALVDAVHDQRLRWLKNLPESGLTVSAVRLEKEKS